MDRSGRCCFFVLAAAALLPATLMQAGEQSFPYQAVVVQEQVEVRCGPGTGFYVTSLLKENDQVTVHRHDHGGWYMIAPPAGSFSWIEASLVQQSGPGSGIVNVPPDSAKAGRAVVRIGSRLSEDHAFFGRELSHGEEVQILGEKTLETKRGPVKMLMITPPAQEFRWVKGEALVPKSHQIQQAMAADPYQVPPQHRQRMAAEGKIPIVMSPPKTEVAPILAAPELPPPAHQMAQTEPALPVRTAQIEKTDKPAPPTGSPVAPMVAAPRTQATVSAEFERLHEIDQQYAEMMQRDPAEWQLEGIVQAYRELMERTPANLDILIQERLTVVERRAEIAAQYQHIVQVSHETSRRDAELVAQQEVTHAAHEMAEFLPPEAGPVPASGEMQAAASVPVPTSPAALAPTPPAMPKLDGAGMLQKIHSRPGMPQYVLLTPQGRLLAYVSAAEEIHLEDWEGQAVGIVGERRKQPAWGSDHLQAKQILPVQLTR